MPDPDELLTPVPASNVSEGLREAHNEWHGPACSGDCEVMRFARAALAHAAPEGLDVETLADALRSIEPHICTAARRPDYEARRILARLRSTEAGEAPERLDDALDWIEMESGPAARRAATEYVRLRRRLRSTEAGEEGT